MYIRKVWKQAGSLAIVLPKELCKTLRIVQGSHVAMSLEKDGSVKMKRLFYEDGTLAVRKGGKAQ